MKHINAITGLKRKRRAHRLPRKKRASHASTVAGRMCSEIALKNADLCLTASQEHLACFIVIAGSNHPSAAIMSTLCLLLASCCLSKASRHWPWDSALMDVTEDDDDVGHHKPLVGITLDSCKNDDECADMTRFRKRGMKLIVDSLGFGEHVRLHCFGPKNYCKFKVEELALCMTRKMVTGRAHKDMTVEFGGCSTRWGRGCSWLIKCMDARFCNCIGPRGIDLWCNEFPAFSEHIRECANRDKLRRKSDGTECILGMEGCILPECNVMSFVDCPHCEHCRPGSGPVDDGEASPRRLGWCPKQRAFCSACQRGMEACVKILATLLPNGVTACVCGPTSGRRNDLTLFRFSDLDDHIVELCQANHGGDLHTTYGDGIFAGNWFCLRTKHYAPPGMELTERQELENLNFASARISVEMSCARAEQLFPQLLIKDRCKLESDAIQLFAEIRVMHLLTNFKVCSNEGSTMTGPRVFGCVPPSLEQCLQMCEQTFED